MKRKDYTGCVGQSFAGVQSKTEKFGYIPAKKRIENLMLAGKNLQAFNAGYYMYNAGSMENFTSADAVALSQPYYSDEISLIERGAYLTGLRKAKADSDRINKDNEEKRKKNEERYNAILKAIEMRVAENSGVSSESGK